MKFSEQLETAVKSSLNKYFGKNNENRQVAIKSDTVQKDLCLITVSSFAYFDRLSQQEIFEKLAEFQINNLARNCE